MGIVIVWVCERGIYLVRHSETTIIRRRPPDVRNKRHIEKVNEIQPAVEDEPPILPVGGHEVLVALAGEDPAVDEEEDEDHHDAEQDAVPEFAVHARFDGLFARDEVFGR